MEIKGFIDNFVETAQMYIEKYEECKDLTGAQKKERLDDIITNYVNVALDGIGLNFIVKFIIRKLLIENIPFITQQIFNLIQARIKGITKQ